MNSCSPDRYVTFQDIDFEGNMREVLGHLFRYIDDKAHANAFWDRFKQRLNAARGNANATTDQLLLLHAHVYYMVELFEEHEDAAALAALYKLEKECF